LDDSLQWQFFRRTVELLRQRGNQVFVLVGPFNEHMLTEGGLRTYLKRKEEVAAWLLQERIPHFIPPALRVRSTRMRVIRPPPAIDCWPSG